MVALAEEVFNVELLQPFGKALIQLHGMNKKLSEAQSKLPSRPAFSLQWLNDDLLQLGCAKKMPVVTRQRPASPIGMES